MTAPSAASPSPVVAWPGWARVLASGLLVLAYANLLFVAALLLADVLEGGDRAPPRAVVIVVALFSALPRALVALLRWLFSATLQSDGERYVVEQRRLRFEVPLASIAATEPWRLPLPGPGFSLRLASGRVFERGLESAVVAPFGLRDWASSFAHARGALHRTSVRAYAFKYLLFPLLPAGVIFRAQQVISYGGPMGQWSLVGPEAYLRNLAGHLAVTVAHLAVIAGVLRCFTEGQTLLATRLRPHSAMLVRRIAEWFIRVCYYGLIPALIAGAFFW